MVWLRGGGGRVVTFENEIGDGHLTFILILGGWVKPGDLLLPSTFSSSNLLPPPSYSSQLLLPPPKPPPSLGILLLHVFLLNYVLDNLENFNNFLNLISN